MNILLLFLAGLVTGGIISRIQKDPKQGPMVDILFGVMGAMLMGSMVSQFTNFSIVILLMAVVGAIVFVEIERVVPEH